MKTLRPAAQLLAAATRHYEPGLAAMTAQGNTPQRPRRCPSPLLCVGANEVQIWASWLDVERVERIATEATLSKKERSIAGRFKFELHRNRYVAGRGMLRKLLGRYLSADPAGVRIVHERQGKPRLALEPANGGIHFNMSHSGNLGLFAFTRAGPVGVDVERLRPVPDASSIVCRFFAPGEARQFRTLDPRDEPAAFFNLWTRKEAIFKATGEGLAAALDQVEISFMPGELARLISVAGNEEQAGEWSLSSIQPAPGFTGAVAVRSRNVAARFLGVA